MPEGTFCGFAFLTKCTNDWMGEKKNTLIFIFISLQKKNFWISNKSVCYANIYVFWAEMDIY